MPGGSSVRSLLSTSLKATRDEIDQIVSVGSISRPIVHHYYQSFDFNLLSWKKLHGQIHENQWLKLINRTEVVSINILLGQGERRNKTQIYQARGGREGTKDVSATNESTYKDDSEARESKMPGGSSVRSLLLRDLKATRDEIDQIVSVGSISRPIAHHYYQSFDFNSLSWKKGAWPNSRKSMTQAHLQNRGFI